MLLQAAETQFNFNFKGYLIKDNGFDVETNGPTSVFLFAVLVLS